jgi:hydroxymethylglutaryl-CoA synthase
VRLRSRTGIIKRLLKDRLKIMKMQPIPQNSQTCYPVGIVGYGAYVPRYRLPRKKSPDLGGWAADCHQRIIRPRLDEMRLPCHRSHAQRIAARFYSIRRNPAVWVGSETHPYAVKKHLHHRRRGYWRTPRAVADWSSPCKGRTEALDAAIGFVGSGMGITLWRLAWTPPRENPGDAWNTPPAQAGGVLPWPPGSHWAVIEAASRSHRHTRFLAPPGRSDPRNGQRDHRHPLFSNTSPAPVSDARRVGEKKHSDYATRLFTSPTSQFPPLLAVCSVSKRRIAMTAVR